MTNTSPRTSTGSPAGSAEFRSYRRFVTAAVLAFVSLGTFYLLLSVTVSLYRSRTSTVAHEESDLPLDAQGLSDCVQALSDVTISLGKHLENFHYLLGGYAPSEAQRWADEGAIWRSEWSRMGQRCRFGSKPAPAQSHSQILREMQDVHREIGATESSYTQELKRFGEHQAPRLDRIRERLGKISRRLETKETTL